MISLDRFRLLERTLRDRGFGEAIDWSENITPPTDAEDFAARVIYVICNAGMNVRMANVIYERCMGALSDRIPIRAVFGHPGKAGAIEKVWEDRASYFKQVQSADDLIETLETLPWIGPVTSFHLAKNLGQPAAKPDVHLVRLAAVENVSVSQLCERLADQCSYKVSTVDTVLWRACAEGILNSRIYQLNGWGAAFRA